MSSRGRTQQVYLQLASTQDLEERMTIIWNSSDVFHTECRGGSDESGHRDCTTQADDRWSEFMEESGIIDLLLDWLSVPYRPTTTAARFAFWVVRALDGVFSHFPPTMSEDRRRNILKKVPLVFNSQMKTIRKLESARPRLPDAFLVMNETTVVFLASVQSFFDRIDDTEICDLIDKDALFGSICACLFTTEPHGVHAEDSRPFVMRRCMYMVPDCKDSKHSLVERMWTTYGAKTISKECARLLLLSPAKTDTISGVDSLIVIFLKTSNLNRQWDMWAAEVHHSVVRGFWRSLKLMDGSDGPPLSRNAYRLMCLLRLFLDLRALGQSPQLICKMVEDYVEEIDQLLGQWGDWITLECQTDKSSDLLEGYCRPAWLLVQHRLTQLAVEERSKKADLEQWNPHAAARDIWTTFGRRMKIPEAVPPHQRKKMTTKQGEREGCSWFKCPFHLPHDDGPQGWEMFQCSKCHKVQYCGTSCQKRHWRSGHERECVRADI